MKRGWPKRLDRMVVVASMCVFLAATGVQAQTAAPVKTLIPPSTAPRSVTQLIVKFRDSANANSSDTKTTMSVERMAALSKSAGDNLKYKRPMALGAHVFALSQAATRDDARAIAKRLMANDSTIEYAVPDEVKRPLFRPNDPYFTGGITLSGGLRQGQWNLMAPTDSYTYMRSATQTVTTAPAGGANLIGAWDITKGDGIVIGVIDTGVVSHGQVNGGLVSGVPATSGYDFIKDIDTAGDGDARDADPSDPGDFTTAAQCGTGETADDSTWHGTFVSGVLVAATDDAVGTAGIAPNARVLTARALGRCGGLTSDIVDAMSWAAGLAVPGAPTNAHPARVLNLSLGGTVQSNTQPDACSAPEQAAVTAIRAARVVVVAASGNDGATIIASPANCTGVIAVTAHSLEGDNAYYANVGNSGTTPVTNTTTISAPGGGCGNQSYDGSKPAGSMCDATGISGANQFVISTINKGTTTPVTTNGDTYAGYAGTSMATPHVAGIAALLLSINPTLAPDVVQNLLTSTARAFPTNTYCQLAGAAAPTQPNPCGAGMVDATAAVTELLARKPTLTISAAQTVNAGSTATVSGTGSVTANAHVPATTSLSYIWTQVSGATVTLAGATSATATFTAPSTLGAIVLALTVEDGNGYEQTTSTTVTVQAAPVVVQSSGGGGGGGGAIGTLGLALLALAAFALRGNRVLARRAAQQG